MSQNLILLPVLVQVFLTFAVLVHMGGARRASIRERRQELQDLALARDTDWSPDAIKASNNFKNQFELPVLFYAAAAFALITRTVDATMLALAATFSATRIAHTLVHLGPNIVAWRGITYIAGFVALVVMWLLIGWRVLAEGSGP